MSNHSAMADLCHLSYAFNNPEGSDLLLIFTASAPCHSGKRVREEDEAPASQVSFHAHQLVLQQSELYRTKQSFLLQQQQRGGAAVADQPRLEIQVEPELLEAAETVTRFIYGGALPDGPVMLFVRAYRLAHFLGLPRCMAACMKALDDIHVESLGEDVVWAVYSLPEWLLECEDIKLLLSKWSACLVTWFDDVPAIVTNDAQLERFCALPYPAVLSWLKADNLKVNSENEVLLLLLGSWVRVNKGCSEKQLEELAHNVRVLHLSPSYLHTVLPNLSMFRKELGKLPLLLAGRELAQRDKLGPSWWNPQLREALSGWVRPARSGIMDMCGVWVLGRPYRTQQIELVVKGRELEALYNLEAVHSPRLYANGFYLKTYVQVEAVGMRWELKAGVKCDAAAMCKHFGEADAEALVNNIAVGVQLRWRVCGPRYEKDANVIVMGHGYSWPLGSGQASDNIHGAVAPFLNAGKLCVDFIIDAVA